MVNIVVFYAFSPEVGVRGTNVRLFKVVGNPPPFSGPDALELAKGEELPQQITNCDGVVQVNTTESRLLVELTRDEDRHGPILLPQAPTQWTVHVQWTVPNIRLPMRRQHEGLRMSARLQRETIVHFLELTSLPGAPEVVFQPPFRVIHPVGGTGPQSIPGPIGELAFAFDMPPPATTPSYVPYVLKRGDIQDAIHVAVDLMEARPLDSIDNYEEIFANSGFPTPQSALTFDKAHRTITDVEFARKRLCGLNPMTLCKVGSEAMPTIPEAFAVAPSEWVEQRTGKKLKELLETGRLYGVDYQYLQSIRNKSLSNRTLPAPFALFYRTRPNVRSIRTRLKDQPALERGAPNRPERETAPRAVMLRKTFEEVLSEEELLPLGIIVEPGQPVVFADGTVAWNGAKIEFQIADLNVHEMQYHLWDCHFGMGPFTISAVRKFDPGHPLRELLDRHFFGLLWVNNRGLINLVDPGGRADRLLGRGLIGAAGLLSRANTQWSFRDKGLVRDLERRGLANGEASLRSYPYRDDALLLNAAIGRYVREYLDLYYKTDDDVLDDWELDDWLVELRGKVVAGVPMGLFLRDIPEVRTRDDLTAFLTQIVFQSTVQHAAVNSPQWDEVAFIPNGPGAHYGLPFDPSTPSANGPQYPPKRDSLDMIRLMAELTQYMPDPAGLGHYNWFPPFMDARAEAVAQRFRDALARDVQREVVRRNAEDGRPQYTYLLPSRISNSTAT